MKVNYNAQAIIANNKLKVNDNKLSNSIGRLSTGLKIKDAKDNPSGLAMARRMNAQIEGMGVAGNSAKDGMNIIKTADGVLNEIHDILQRMNELAVKGANATITPTDRDYIESEIQQLKDEIQRIANTTDFNGQKILDGTFDYRGYATDSAGKTDPYVTVASYSDSLAGKQFTLKGLEALTYDYDEATQTGTKQLYGVTVPHNVTFEDINNPAANYQMKIVSIDGDLVNMEDEKGNSLSVSIRKKADATINLDLTDIGPMTIQVGANEGQVLDMRIPAINLTSLGLFGLSVKESLNNYSVSKDTLTEEGASKKAIESIKNALNYVSELRSKLGAYQNRLEHTDANLDATSENLTASYSQIMDVDMAEEMTNYSTQQVLSEAGISILAQANERASLALQLLQA